MIMQHKLCFELCTKEMDFWICEFNIFKRFLEKTWFKGC